MNSVCSKCKANYRLSESGQACYQDTCAPHVDQETGLTEYCGGRGECRENQNLKRFECACVSVGYNSSDACGSCIYKFSMESNCTECVNSGYNRDTLCSQCTVGSSIVSECTECDENYDISTNCSTCISNHYNINNKCISCP